MKKNRLHIKHELLNLMTVLHQLLLEEKISAEARRQMLLIVEKSTLLIAYQDLLLGKSPDLFPQPTSLNELLETAVLVHQEGQKKTRINFLKKNMILSMDRTHVGESLKIVIKKILQTSKNLTFHFDETTNELHFHYDGKNIIPSKKELLSSLHEDELQLWIATNLLKRSHIGLRQKKQELILRFPVKPH